MKLTIRYVAALRDRMGRAEEVLDLPDTVHDSEGVIACLRQRDAAADALVHSTVRVIRNDAILPRPVPVADGDTLAFCPPFTGG